MDLLNSFASDVGAVVDECYLAVADESASNKDHADEVVVKGQAAHSTP